FRVERTATVKAPPEKVFALIADFRAWTRWSPWEGLDPALKRTHSGAASGKGAVYAWEGNSQVGQGRMEIVEATAPAKVAIDLQFIKPYAARNVVEFSLQPKGGETAVTWAMHGPNQFIGKVMSVFMSMDRMIGKNFEDGLAALKSAAEK
ncbi:MAG: SRPBCC family protein, partial [Alphaproteobacteria bacterium]|nr:SRPBCC family protein [Alphaproteobacteria bacterium]